jgi:hypothetical protein
VWQRVSVWSDGLVTVPVPNVSVETWWNSSVRGGLRINGARQRRFISTLPGACGRRGIEVFSGGVHGATSSFTFDQRGNSMAFLGFAWKG